MTPFENAWNYYGLKEVEGPDSNPQILEMIRKYASWVNDDSAIAWCAMGMHYVFTECGYPVPDDPYKARSWIGYGVKVSDIGIAQAGDVLVFWRGSKEGTQGHVTFMLNVTEDGKHVNCYGGNQDNAWCIRRYALNRLLYIGRVPNFRDTDIVWR